MKNGSARRALKIIEMLACRFMDGMSNKELAEAVSTSEANICRDLTLLYELGWIRKLDTGRWTSSVKLLAIARAYTLQFEKIQNRMAETERNIGVAAIRYGG
ncbi:MAG: IclR family transcriptional regulator [Desulfovibrio sp.]|jgi:DNA-binding IclR family transcriptional regulator|nr:IclR family transcriptional regulator [Desulfovibrio sp.]